MSFRINTSDLGVLDPNRTFDLIDHSRLLKSTLAINGLSDEGDKIDAAEGPKSPDKTGEEKGSDPKPTNDAKKTHDAIKLAKMAKPDRVKAMAESVKNKTSRELQKEGREFEREISEKREKIRGLKKQVKKAERQASRVQQRAERQMARASHLQGRRPGQAPGPTQVGREGPAPTSREAHAKKLIAELEKLEKDLGTLTEDRKEAVQAHFERYIEVNVPSQNFSELPEGESTITVVNDTGTLFPEDEERLRSVLDGDGNVDEDINRDGRKNFQDYLLSQSEDPTSGTKTQLRFQLEGKVTVAGYDLEADEITLRVENGEKISFCTIRGFSNSVLIFGRKNISREDLETFKSYPEEVLKKIYVGADAKNLHTHLFLDHGTVSEDEQLKMVAGYEEIVAFLAAGSADEFIDEGGTLSKEDVKQKAREALDSIFRAYNAEKPRPPREVWDEIYAQCLKDLDDVDQDNVIHLVVAGLYRHNQELAKSALGTIIESVEGIITGGNHELLVLDRDERNAGRAGEPISDVMEAAADMVEEASETANEVADAIVAGQGGMANLSANDVLTLLLLEEMAGGPIATDELFAKGEAEPSDEADGEFSGYIPGKSTNHEANIAAIQRYRAFRSSMGLAPKGWEGEAERREEGPFDDLREERAEYKVESKPEKTLVDVLEEQAQKAKDKTIEVAESAVEGGRELISNGIDAVGEGAKSAGRGLVSGGRKLASLVGL